MMRRSYLLFIPGLLALGSTMALAQANIATSLHYTREGKNTAYRADNGGMEVVTGIPMSELSCQKCHATSGTYANGDPVDAATYEPSCNDCHNFAAGTAVAEETCLGCHNRQTYERGAYPGADVHQQAGMTCVSCHSKEELHGDDGIAYQSLKEPGAIQVACEDCHAELASNPSHDVHAGSVDCAACHATAVLTCASCHFESLVTSGKNRAINQLRNYRLLVEKDGEVRLGAFMTHTYDGKTNYIISSYHSHAIERNATTCGDCHGNMGNGNAAIREYNESGTIAMTTWNPETQKIEGPSGVVPIPPDWRTALRFDFATYESDPAVFPSDPQAWTYLKSEVDNAHLFYAEPLGPETLEKLGMSARATAVSEPAGSLPSDFGLEPSYPNPFNPETTIRFTLPAARSVQLSIHDVSGRRVRSVLSAEPLAGGPHAYTWDGRDDAGQPVASGVYLTKLSAGPQSAVVKMTLLK